MQKKNRLSVYALLITQLFCTASAMACDNDNSGIELQPIAYYLKRTSHSIVGRNGSKITSHCAPSLEYRHGDLRVGYYQERVTTEISPDIQKVLKLEEGKSSVCVKEGPTYQVVLSKLLSLKNGEQVVAPSSQLTQYLQTNNSQAARSKRQENITHNRARFGFVCVPPDLTADNGDVLHQDPYLITCQDDKLTIFTLGSTSKS